MTLISQATPFAERGRVWSCRNHQFVAKKLYSTIRPGKLDLLFCISDLLDLRAGRWSLFIIRYWQIPYTLGKSMVLWPLKVGVSLLGR